MGIVGAHPAVFVRVANKGLRGYGTWKSAEVNEKRGDIDREKLRVVRSEWCRNGRVGI
jgi:hypothetical protein